MKRAGILLLALCTSLCFRPEMAAKAADGQTEGTTIADEIQKEELFYTDSDVFHYDFDHEIVIDGQKYKLDKVDYEEVLAKEHRVDSPEYPEERVKADDQEWNLVDVIEREQVQTDRSVYVEQDSISFEQEEWLVVNAKDPDTGDEIAGTITLQSASVVGGEWVNDLKLLLTFSRYDALVYQFEGIWIPHDDQMPAFGDNTPVILDHVGLSHENHRIEDIAWQGDTYMQDGVVCRDAVATGSSYKLKYQCHYAGDIVLPDLTITEYTGVYEDAREFKYEVKAVATYQVVGEPITIEQSVPAEESSSEAAIATRGNQSLVILLSVVGVVAVFAVVVILFIIAKQKKQKRDAEEAERK